MFIFSFRDYDTIFYIHLPIVNFRIKINLFYNSLVKYYNIIPIYYNIQYPDYLNFSGWFLKKDKSHHVCILFCFGLVNIYYTSLTPRQYATKMDTEINLMREENKWIVIVVFGLILNNILVFYYYFVIIHGNNTLIINYNAFHHYLVVFPYFKLNYI